MRDSSRRSRVRVSLALLVGAVLVGLDASSGAQAAGGKARMTLFAVATRAQFMNHADDRMRGMSTNPFNVNTKALVIVTQGKEKGNGPFPGDDILYSFNLYKDNEHKQRAGRAMFTCYFNFVKHAICDSYFELKDGVLLASGSVVFNAKRFTLGVSGGTSRYLGASGQVAAMPAANNAQRLAVVLVR